MREVPFADPDVDERPAFLDPDLDLDDEVPPSPARDDHGIVLPPIGSGVRARRRRELRRYTWRRNGRLVIAALVVIVLAVTLLVAHPWHGGSGETKKAAPALVPATLPLSAMLVQQDAQGAAGSITLFVANPS